MTQHCSSKKRIKGGDKLRTEKEIREKLEQIEKDLEELDNFYDDDEISKEGYEKSHKILSAWEYHLKWVLGEENNIEGRIAK